MAKRVRRFNLIHEDGTVIPVCVKTTSDRFFMKLIEDYRNMGKFAAGKVTWVEVA